ncbi:hypothetical protein OOZ63_25120 [Paucibacter sp. PLA-PC-4]|uniref:hypothetical protein n=1 Tax=Paucibacter sp. PLA-PC-4 TaxID=2993655 RepID=UPI00224B2DB1|nr:hypothetical protein [Paucibacter sp. PLA-PC-4]MCX2865114.1 hypothetical protein [Paucibacter sp. PLA-PC-4]
MKKFVFKATALAIGALVGGSAFAAITLSDTTADARTYATELVASGDNLSDANLATTSKLGFGVSAAATRYVRFDLTNAKWNTAVTPARLDAGVAAAGTSYTPDVAVVAGGTTADSYVIFQVTADVNYDQGDALSLALNTIGVKVTSTASPVALTYAMFETAGQAVANDANVKLAGYSETIAKFGKALSFVVTPGTQVASVEKAFKEFTTTGTNSAPLAKTAKLGKVDNTVGTAFTAAGVAVANADLIAAGTKLVVTGDFGAKGSVFLDGDDNCATSATAATFATGNTTTASITTGAAAVLGNVCYTVTGDTAVPEQVASVVYDVTAAGASTTADTASTTLGTILHDGTTLQAPFATIHPDYLSRVVLTSTYGVDAAVSASVITEDGISCAAGTTSFTLKAGKQLFINTKDICPSLSTGVTRLAVKLDVVAPSSSISGVYNVMNYNQTTGATDSLISYPLLRPGTN